MAIPRSRFVQAMHEGPAAYMAAAYAKAKRGLAVCLASSGAGATNLLTGTAYAYKESIPLIALSSDVRSREAGKGASSWHEIPQREMFEPVTKMSVTLNGRADSRFPARSGLAGDDGKKGPGLHRHSARHPESRSHASRAALATDASSSGAARFRCSRARGRGA
jgi:hypothetical protein